MRSLPQSGHGKERGIESLPEEIAADITSLSTHGTAYPGNRGAFASPKPGKTPRKFSSYDWGFQILVTERGCSSQALRWPAPEFENR